MNKKRWIISAGIFLAIVGLVLFACTVLNRKPATVDYANRDQGISLRYEESLKQGSLSDDDLKSNIMLRLNNEEPSALVTVRYEEGFKALSVATKQKPLDLIVGNLSKRYPNQFPEYDKLEEKRIKIANRDAVEIIFSYKGDGGARVKQRFVAIMKDDNKAFYVAAQAAYEDYDNMSQQFDELVESITFD